MADPTKQNAPNISLETQHYKMIREMNLPNRAMYWRIKRLCDLCASFVALLLLSPLFLIICLMIVIDDPKGGPFYVQTRCGRGGKPFRMIKFRTMFVDADKRVDELLAQNEMAGPAFKIKNDPRITRAGKILRATSLDELPQLINVLRGEMTIVGPRPPLPREVALYNEYQFQRLYVTPGLTCYWQIAPNRNEISFDAWVEMDIEYIIERTLRIDLKIIGRTVLSMLRRSGE